jgi:hypothetical protein
MGGTHRSYLQYSKNEPSKQTAWKQVSNIADLSVRPEMWAASPLQGRNSITSRSPASVVSGFSYQKCWRHGSCVRNSSLCIWYAVTAVLRSQIHSRTFQHAEHPHWIIVSCTQWAQEKAVSPTGSLFVDRWPHITHWCYGIQMCSVTVFKHARQLSGFVTCR